MIKADTLCLILARESPQWIPDGRGIWNKKVKERIGGSICYLVQALLGEGPVCLRGSSVMVVDEGDSARRPPADHARRLSRSIPQPPVLALCHSLLRATICQARSPAGIAESAQ